MTRSAAALAALMAVLVLSLPGGMCFFWAGLGVEHHHHADTDDHGGSGLCVHFHHHHHDGHGHDCDDHHGGEPVEPCQPSEEPALAASQGVFKLDAEFTLAVGDFSPNWAKAPDFALSSGGQFSAIASRKRPDAPPPPAEVRLCRFLI